MINFIKLWDVASGNLKWTSTEGDLGMVLLLVFSPDAESHYCRDATATSRIHAWTGQTRQDLMKASSSRSR
ncbi:MAG: hypothetical protein ACP5XB_16830 [Isosphaeraceae bacterium]